jgi:hypothetical protein
LMQLIEPLTARTAATALRNAPAVRICRGRIFVHHRHVRSPELRAAAASGAVGEHRRAAGQRHAERLARHMHGIGRRHTGAHAGSLDGVFAHALQSLAGQFPKRCLDRPQEKILDVDVFAGVPAARLVAAYHQNARNIEAAGRHQVRRQARVPELASCRRAARPR